MPSDDHREDREESGTGSRARRERGMPIARLLPLVLGALVLFASAPVLVLGYLAAEDNTSRLLRDRTEIIVDDVVKQLDAYLSPPVEQLKAIQRAADSGQIDARTPMRAPFSAFVLGSLAAVPQVEGVALVRADRSVLRFDRNAKTVRTEPPGRVANADTYLTQARRRDAPTWLGPAWSGVLGKTILRLAAPLRAQEAGGAPALVSSIATADLSGYLRQIREDGGPVAFVLAGRDRVIAHPNMAEADFAFAADANRPLPRIDQVGDPALAEIWNARQNDFTALARFRRAEGHWTWVGDESYGYIYRTIDAYGTEPWIVGIRMPGVDTRRERWIVNGIAIGGTVLLAIALGAAIVTGRWLRRPILNLARAAERLEAFEFDKVRDVPRGPIREVNWAAAAFERLAVGLRLFETYVPGPVARALLKEGGTLKPEVRTASILFADIAAFTSIVETMAPDRVVEMLNGYFDTIAPIVERNGGVINQFQGDAVLASFNLPNEDPDHAAKAVAAAREMIAAVHGRTFAGQTLRIRVGVNTGLVVGGSFGSKGRLNYTIHGDAVNLAARLEALNKTYGTTLLVSQSTALASAPVERFSEIGTITLRGHVEAVTIYTIDETAVPPETDGETS